MDYYVVHRLMIANAVFGAFLIAYWMRKLDDGNLFDENKVPARSWLMAYIFPVLLITGYGMTQRGREVRFGMGIGLVFMIGIPMLLGFFAE